MMKSFVIMMVMMSLMVGTSMASGECNMYGRCPAGYCCSKYGYCGVGPAYCGDAEMQVAHPSANFFILPSMATKLMQPPIIPASHSFPQLSQIKIPLTSSFSLPNSKLNCTKFKHYLSSGFTLRVDCTTEEHSSDLLLNNEDINSLTKSSIYNSIEGTNRGVFGVTSDKKREIEDLVMELEANNPTPNPTHTLDKIIDIAEGKAVNIIKFSARGLILLNGQLTVQASFSVVSPSRVSIKYDNSQITPEKLMNLFKKNYDLLLGIFNPEGWLEITYVDDTMRIGRDNKGNIFILERTTDS